MTVLLLWLLSAALVLIGLAGTLLPVLPGVPLVFVGLAVAAWIDGFQRVGMVAMIVIGLLAVASLVVDFVASVRGARTRGASRTALIGAGIGTLAGLPFGILGVLVGPFLGAAVGQLIGGGTLDQAARVGLGTWLGFLYGTLAKIAIAAAMIAIFVIAYVV